MGESDIPMPGQSDISSLILEPPPPAGEFPLMYRFPFGFVIHAVFSATDALMIDNKLWPALPADADDSLWSYFPVINLFNHVLIQ
jgi:hypothetical protein